MPRPKKRRASLKSKNAIGCDLGNAVGEAGRGRSAAKACASTHVRVFREVHGVRGPEVSVIHDIDVRARDHSEVGAGGDSEVVVGVSGGASVSMVKALG